MTKEQLKDYGMKVTQANGTELVKLTLELSAIYIGEAVEKINDEAEFRKSISKARAFIGHLITSLNMEYAISRELLNIYLYINTELQKSEIRKDVTLLPRIKGIAVRGRNIIVLFSCLSLFFFNIYTIIYLIGDKDINNSPLIKVGASSSY